MAGEGTKKLLFPNNQNTAGYVLSRGAKGDAVRIAQLRLIELGYSCGASGADSQFGGGTYNSVCDFQRLNGLKPDGVAGPETLAILYSSNPKRYEVIPPTIPVIPGTNDIIDYTVQVFRSSHIFNGSTYRSNI